MRSERTSESVPWKLSCAALLTVVLVLFATQAHAGEKDAAATVIVPDGGRIVQQGDQLYLYDAKSNRIGYGYTRPDGSMDVFNRDGSRRATIEQDPGGRVRVRCQGVGDGRKEG